MIAALMNLGSSVMSFFTGKQNITQTNAQTVQTRVQELHSGASVFWLTILEAVLVLLLLWNGIIAPNFHLEPIKTTFDATTLLFQLLGVTALKHGILKVWS